MGILAARRQRRTMQGHNAKKGVDFIHKFITLVLVNTLPDIVRNVTKVITDAGALDPVGCKQEIEELLKKMKIQGIKVAAVLGDDVLEDKEDPTLNSDRLSAQDEPLVSLNAYLGAHGVAAALKDGAHIIVTGRVVDSALVVGPLMYEYDWKENKTENYYDLLASASLAGHIIECGCHMTGGNFTVWQSVAQSPYGGYSNMGYPIVEFYASGGLVTPATVSEQILYEILDPALYLLPDVILDMRQVKLSLTGNNRVLVTGAKGIEPTPFLKCSGIFLDGWKISAELLIGGLDAHAVGEAIFKRVRNMYKQMGIEDFRNINIEAIGGETLFGPHSRVNDTREVLLRLTAHHDDRKALDLVAMETISSATCMVPGITGSAAGRPRPTAHLVHFPLLIPKSQVSTRYVVDTDPIKTVGWGSWDTKANYGNPAFVPPIPAANLSEPFVKTRLIDVAYGRSGDKDDVCNISIIARDPKFLPYIKRSITEQVMSDYMKHLCKGTVTRFELPGPQAMNFVLTHSLNGGGLSSLGVDRQGKTYAQLCLSGLYVEIPASFISVEAKL